MIFGFDLKGQAAFNGRTGASLNKKVAFPLQILVSLN